MGHFLSIYRSIDRLSNHVRLHNVRLHNVRLHNVRMRVHHGAPRVSFPAHGILLSFRVPFRVPAFRLSQLPISHALQRLPTPSMVLQNFNSPLALCTDEIR